jgi:hypothetical protein
MRKLTLPRITRKQQEILQLLYTHRFLTRIQIQTILKHKDKKTINLWLKDLRDKDYINWIYNKDNFAEKTKPAIYHLGINGIRHLQDRDSHPSEELRKRYREHERSPGFIDRCLVIADTCINLEQARDEDDYLQTWYFYETEADYLSDGYYHFMGHNELIHPHLCFNKEQYEGTGESETTESYLLEVFDATLPRYRLRYRLGKYVQYFDEELDDWRQQTYDDPQPTILLVCATLTDLIYAKRRTRGLMNNIWDFDDEDRPSIRFTVMEKFKEHGILAPEIWETA